MEKRPIVKKVKYCGVNHLFMRTKEKDYALIENEADVFGFPFFEDKLEKLLPRDVIAVASKATFDEIKHWKDTLTEYGKTDEVNDILSGILESFTDRNSRKLYLLNSRKAKLINCWRFWFCEDQDLNYEIRKAISNVCKEGISIEGVRTLKDLLDRMDTMEHMPSSLWTVNWVNRDAVKITVRCEGDETDIFLILI